MRKILRLSLYMYYTDSYWHLCVHVIDWNLKVCESYVQKNCKHNILLDSSPLKVNPLLSSSVVISSLRGYAVCSNMLHKLLLITTLTCMTKCDSSVSYSMENLYAILGQTTEYFKNFTNGKILILII